MSRGRIGAPACALALTIAIAVAAALAVAAAAVAAAAVAAGRAAHGPQAFTPAEVDRLFARIPTTPPTNATVIDEPQYEVAVARVARRNGPPEQHDDGDRVFVVRQGRAAMRVGGRIAKPDPSSPSRPSNPAGPRGARAGDPHGAAAYDGYRTVPLEPGALLSVPRGVPYQIVAEDGDVSFVVIRIRSRAK